MGLIACASDNGEEAAITKQYESRTGDPLVLYRGSTEGPAALMNATLRLESETCLYAIDEFGQWWLLVVPSPNTTWKGETQSLEIDGVTVGLSQRVGFGGGVVEELDDLGDALLSNPDPSCNTNHVWMVTRLVA